MTSKTLHNEPVVSQHIWRRGHWAISVMIMLILILSPQVLPGEEPSEAAISAVRLFLAGGSVEQGPGDEVSITLIGSRTITDEGLPAILKPYPKLAYLYMGNTNLSDAALKEAAKYPELKFLGLINTKVTDAGLKELESLKKLEVIYLAANQISDEGLKSLGKITSLKEILLNRTQVTDDGLKHLKKLDNLVSLDLSATQVTDKGLMHLSELKNLRSLGVMGTKVTQEGERSLQKLLPELQIEGNSTEQGDGGGGGGQQADPKFEATVADPAFKDKHPSVLFDEAHDNFHTASGRYKPFADLIISDGYRVVPGKKSFTAERLAEFQMLIIANATGRPGKNPSAFTKEECDVVEAWVKAGGSLLLVTDHEPFGSGSKELGARFGVDMSLRVATDPQSETGNGLEFARAKEQLGDHWIMTGRNESEHVDRVLTFTGQSLKGPPGSTALLIFSKTAIDVEWEQDDSVAGRLASLAGSLLGGRQAMSRKENSAAGRAQGVALEFGRGRVVVMGEAAELSAQMAGGQRFGMNTPGCDNRKMVLNIVHWLAHLDTDSPQKTTRESTEPKKK